MKIPKFIYAFAALVLLAYILDWKPSLQTTVILGAWAVMWFVDWHMDNSLRPLREQMKSIEEKLDEIEGKVDVISETIEVLRDEITEKSREVDTVMERSERHDHYSTGEGLSETDRRSKNEPPPLKNIFGRPVQRPK